MDFFDNVVNKSNALIKERLNNPFGTKQASAGQDQAQSQADADTSALEPTSSPAATTADQQATISQSNPTTTDASQDSGDQDANKNGNNSQFAAIAADAEAVAQKAAQGAKTFGTFLFSMANKAGQHVSQTAKQVKQAVESTSILTDFTREQQEFIKEHGGSLQAGELPWIGCDDENKAADMRDQILSLSQDKRNFVRNPPNGANFHFDPQQSYPIALALLKEDPNLNNMRYELVPKLVSEDTFWRNYFYRVSVLRQMSEKGENIKKGWSSSRSSSGEGPDEDGQHDEPLSPSYNSTAPSVTTTPGPTPATELLARQESYQAAATTTTTTSQVVSPIDYQITQELESSESRKLVAEADDLKSKLRELNIGSLDDQDDEKWEEELQRDLQEFELVSGGDVSPLDEEALDSEIMELKRSN